MIASTVSSIAGASDAAPDPYSADSMASSNRKTSARSAAETAVRARIESASDAVRPSPTILHISAIKPMTADRMDRRASTDRPAASDSRASASLRWAAPGVASALPDQVSRFTAMCRDAGDQAPHSNPRTRRDPGEREHVDTLIM